MPSMKSFAIRRISLSIRRQHTKSADDYIAQQWALDFAKRAH